MKYLEAIRDALNQALEENQNVLLLGEDICDPYGGAFKVTKGISTKFPSRVINTPISEASIVGVASGLALRGFRPIVEIMFGDFLTLCADQIINHASKFHWMYNNEANIPMLIRTPMGGFRGYGATHSQSMERLFFAFPGIEIYFPSHFHNIKEILLSCLNRQNPILFAEHKLLYSKDLVEMGEGYHEGFRLKREYIEGDEIVFLSSCDIDENPSITILTYGGMSPVVFSAAKKLLFEEEIVCEVVIHSRIKPFSLQALAESIQRSGKVLIVEEGHLSWGWGSEVGMLLTDKYFGFLKSPIKRVAALDLPIPCSKPLELEMLPSEQDIINTIITMVRL